MAAPAGLAETVEARFKEIAPKADFCSLRLVEETSESLSVRQNVLQPATKSVDVGAMITVISGGGLGYAATSDLSLAGLKRAADEALAWAKQTSGRSVVDFRSFAMPKPDGEYRSRVERPWGSVSLTDKIELLKTECARLKTDARIVDWMAGLEHVECETLLITADGARVQQSFRFLIPYMAATANEGAETESRSLGGRGICRQGGLEILDRIGFRSQAPRVAEEALQLLTAPNCPSAKMHVLLAPDQMILQIHESIGHPLELDRILGDERNYAGTSFVTLDMFGSYRYGSDLLNVTYDPSRPEQLATFGYDDDGLRAERQFIIRGGILERPLGGVTSQARAGVDGVANSRASSWNRPPIDRMANLNLEPGTSSLDEMIAQVENGVHLHTNVSWSIDDSRNKFQFGCEYGQRIENGKLTSVVKKPNYRGISATFWRNLAAVGRPDNFDVLGTPNCGKGEPNQVIRVGHASPTCLFADVDVFGGA